MLIGHASAGLVSCSLGSNRSTLARRIHPGIVRGSAKSLYWDGSVDCLQLLEECNIIGQELPHFDKLTRPHLCH